MQRSGALGPVPGDSCGGQGRSRGERGRRVRWGPVGVGPGARAAACGRAGPGVACARGERPRREWEEGGLTGGESGQWEVAGAGSGCGGPEAGSRGGAERMGRAVIEGAGWGRRHEPAGCSWVGAPTYAGCCGVWGAEPREEACGLRQLLRGEAGLLVGCSHCRVGFSERGGNPWPVGICTQDFPGLLTS